ncbi:MAG: hypothetical protein Q8P15_00215 [Nanoarchaeota archaeon]|nr:hypothetical protein [Nanoarchaeota archaeon]
MENKYLIFGAIVLTLFLAFSVFLKFNQNGNVVQEKNPELEKYRSLEIPEECRLPEYENDLNWWKQHLSHHQNTWYCLEYYGTSIEEIQGGR